jgi:transposase
MVADELDYVVGVDTHRDEHALAAVEAATGAVVARQAVAANARGYTQALRFGQRYAASARVWALEGAGHYGAGLARYLSEHGEAVVEVGRAPRNERRLRGKDDQLDAVRAARAALAREPLARPRSGERREALRLLLIARRSAVDVRREALAQVAWRDRHRPRPAPPRTCASSRPEDCSSAAAASAAQAGQAPTSSRHGSCCAASPAESERPLSKPANSSARSSPKSARSHHNCSTSPASARSSPPN